jgi:HlyD family secretion protein
VVGALEEILTDGLKGSRLVDPRQLELPGAIGAFFCANSREENPMSERDLSALRIDDRDRNGPRKGRKVWLAVIAGVVVPAVAMTVILRGGRAPSVEVAEVRTESAATIPSVLNASGYVTPRRRATVAAKITGRVVEMLVEEGMAVGEGQVLARLDDAEARRRLELARADREVAVATIAETEVNLEDARRTLRRTEELFRQEVVGEQDLDHARAAAEALAARLESLRREVAAAGARVSLAEEDLANCTVRAPFAGIAVSKDAQVGEMVSPVSAGGGFTRTGISTIVDMQSLEIEVDVNESHIAKVQPGQRVEATLDAYPEWKIPAGVRTIIPTADRQKATVKVRIAFDALDPRILPDMGVKVSFLGEPEAEAAGGAARILVPRSALREEGESAVVYVLGRENRLERRAVSTGRENGGEVQVLAGLAPGERVVTAGPAGLRDGQRVRVAE